MMNNNSITTTSGISYTKKQVLSMFSIQVETLLKQCSDVDKKLIKQWISEGQQG